MTLKKLSADDRDTLMIRLLNHHMRVIRNNRRAIADILIDGHVGYNNMTDEKLLEVARRQGVSLSGLEILVAECLA